MKIGFIGVGAIGFPMAERLLADHDLAVYDVNNAQTAALAQRGARAASSAADAARGTDATIVMVATPEQLGDALFNEGVADGAPTGSSVIIMSSVGVAAVVAAAADLRSRGLRVIDAPVTGGVVRALTGELTILLGGDLVEIETVRPVLEVLGANLPICGVKIGDGQAVKLVNQLLCSVHLAVAGEALNLAAALGLDARSVLDVVGSGAASSFMLNDRGPRMFDGDAPVLSAIDIFVKDSGLVQDAAATAGADTPILDAAARRFRQAQEAGLGREDDSAVIHTYSLNVVS